MSEEYNIEIGKYIFGVDNGNNDEIGLSIATIKDDGLYILGSCYGEQAKCLDYVLKEYNKIYQENQQLKQQLEEEKNIRNKAIEFVNNIQIIEWESNFLEKERQELLQILQNKE